MDWYKRINAAVHTHDLRDIVVDGSKFATRRAISRALITTLKQPDHPDQEFELGDNKSFTITDGADETPEQFSKRVGEYQIPPSYVKEFQNVCLSGMYAVGITDRRSIIPETVGDDLYQLWPTISSMIKHDGLHSTLQTLGDLNEPEEEFEYAVSLVSFFADNYYHWVVEHLPQLRNVEYYAEKEGISPLLIIPQDPPKWMRESLRVCGYDDSDWVEWQGGCVSIEHLIVPEHPFRPIEHSYPPRPENWRWLRQRAASGIEQDSIEGHQYSPYIFISREDADSRRIVNREDLLKELQPRGFQSYTLSEMDFKQQVALFNQAEVIIAPHGSGAANIVFADDATFIELCHAGNVRGAFYFMLAQECGHDHLSVLCDPNGVDMSVDVQEVLQHIENRQRLKGWAE